MEIFSTLIIEPMLNSLLWIYSGLAENFGLAIIAFTILVRLITYPLTASQMKSTQGMQEMQKSKKWQDIQKKYKDDREKLAQEQMKLYREMGVSPFGSCLPMLIQFPIWIGLYRGIILALAVTPAQMLELTRHLYMQFNAAILIPLDRFFLWMDLSQPEKDYGIPFPIDIAGLDFNIPILTILVVGTSFLQSRMMTPQSTGGEQAAQMNRSMTLMMPLFMGWITWSLASGMALYFVTSNLVGIFQYGVTGKLNWRSLIPARFIRTDPNE